MIIPEKNNGGPSSSEDPRLTELMQDMPNREVFVKDTNGHMVGTGMLLLENNTLLAPEGFSTESGSIDFGDLITLSEASGFLAIQNNLKQERYRLIDHRVPKNAPSDDPGFIKMIEAENEFVTQGVSDTTLNANPLVFQYTTQLLSRVNSLKFKAANNIANFRMKITAVGPNVVVKYFPTKSAWVQGTNGVSLVAGDNTLDFKDTPLLFEPGTILSFEIRANNVSLLGNSSGTPYLSAMVQRGVFKYIAKREDLPSALSQLSNDTGYATQSSIPKNISQLTNDSGFVTSTQASSAAPVQSVNGQTGNVIITLPPSQVNPDWNSTSGVSQILNKPSSFVPSAHTHPISDVVGLQTSLDSKATVAQAKQAAPVQSVNGQIGDVSLAIPAAQIQSDWNQSNTTALDYIKNKPAIPTVNYPVVSVNSKTGAVVLTSSDVGAASVSHTHTIADVTGLQTALDSKASTSALSGYVTTSSLTTTLNGYATTGALTTGLSGKYNVPTGSTNQYVRGDGSLATFPTIPSVNYPVVSVNGKTGSVVLSNTDVGAAAISHTHAISDITNLQTTLDAKANTSTLSSYATTASLSNYATTAALNNALVGMRKVETFLGTTDALGNYTITFANTYTTPPDVQPQIVGGLFSQFVRIVSVSNTQAVIQAAQRSTATVLGLEVLLGATTAITGASISVQVTSRT